MPGFDIEKQILRLRATRFAQDDIVGGKGLIQSGSGAREISLGAYSLWRSPRKERKT